MRDRLAAERARLTLEIEDVRSELDAIIEAASDAPPDDEHDAEGATIGYERARVQSLIVRLERRLEAVERAGADDEDRRCECCGTPIPLERLLALPGTGTCVNCAP